jgi:hypothetical protein
MTPLRPTTARRLRRLTNLSVASAACLSGLALAASPASASGNLSNGNLLVSTSQFNDLPNIVAGTTVLPISSTVTVTKVTTSGSAPNIVATVTTGSKHGLAVGQSVTIAGVGGSTQLNGTFIVATVPSTTTFTINMGSTAVSTYTSGGTATPIVVATAGNQYPAVFNNEAVDANFGVTEPIILDQIPATTSLVNTPISQITVPNSDAPAANGDQLVTSFPSKSEIALNLSTDGNYVTFMGYHAPTGAIDVSNSNTPNEIDTTNTDTAGTGGAGFYRVAAAMDGNGNFQMTETGAYGGNNGRAAILNTANNTLFMAGNGGNGGTPVFSGVLNGTGTQIANEASTSEAAQEAAGVPAPTPYGNFNIAQIAPNTADKSSKDNNFRGLTQYNGVLYTSKGSGSNGMNTVYFVDTTGQACPAGTGVPSASASLPSLATWTSSSLFPTISSSNAALGLTAANPGLAPANMCVLKGFPTTLAKATTGVSYPFGLWFANPTTLYVADEGSGAGGTADNTGGLQKWVLNTSTNTWSLQYTLTSGLSLQTTYNVNPSPAGVNGGAAGQAYPTGTNAATGKNWAPATDGLRNITGQVNGDGTVTIWATTSTVSGSTDNGADPNEVVAVTDTLANTTASASFNLVMPPTDGVVYRGVSFTPNNSATTNLPEAPWVPLIPLSAGGLLVWRRRQGRAATFSA